LKDKEPEIRSAAALALGQFSDKRVLDLMIKQLSDPAPLARATAAEVLGQLNDQTAVKWLVSELSDPDITVQGRVVRSLKRLGWQPQTASEQKWYYIATGNLNRVAELGPEGIRPLMDLLRNGTPEQQLSAIKALGEVKDERILKLSLEALRKPSTLVKLAALEIIKNFADPSTYDAVERLLGDKEVNLRVAAIGPAMTCGGTRAMPRLLRLLKDPSWEVRREAAKALGHMGDPVAVEGLGKALRDHDHDVREAVAVALGRIGDPHAIGPLALTLIDDESFVRNAAYNALMEIDNHWEKTPDALSALPQIKKAMKYRGYWISQSVSRLLEQDPAEPGVEEATPAVFTMAKPVTKSRPEVVPEPVPQPVPEPVPELVQTSAQEPASGPAGLSPAALAILADMLGDRDRDLRLAAAEAFSQARDPNALAVLAPALQDEDIFVRKTAERALAALN